MGLLLGLKSFANTAKREFCAFFRLSVPIYLTALFAESIGILSVVFAGQVGDEGVSLAGVALSQAIINLTGYLPLLALNSVVDSLVSRSDVVGTNKYTGLLLQRSIIINVYLSLPIAFVWFNTENILILLGQTPAVAATAGQYTLVYISILPAFCLYIPIIKTLQLNEVVLPSILILFSANLLEIAIILPLARYSSIGIASFAIGPVLAFYCIAIGHCVYLRCSRVWRRVWSGFTSEAWEGWAQYLLHGLPMLLIVLFENVTIQIGGFILGGISHQPVVDIGIHTAITYINTLLCISCMSLSLANSIRISRHCMETTQRRRVKRLIISGFCGMLILTLSQSIFLAAGHFFLGRIFSRDTMVVSGLGPLLFLLAAYHPVEGVFILFQGLLKGLERQHMNWLLSSVFFCVSLPLAIVFAIHFTDRPLGYWVGVTCGYFTRFLLCSLLVVICFTLLKASSHHSTVSDIPIESSRLVLTEIPAHTEIPCYNSTIDRIGSLKWKLVLLKLLLLFILVTPFFPLLGCHWSRLKVDFYDMSYIQSPVDMFCMRFWPSNCTFSQNITFCN